MVEGEVLQMVPPSQLCDRCCKQVHACVAARVECEGDEGWGVVADQTHAAAAETEGCEWWMLTCQKGVKSGPRDCVW